MEALNDLVQAGKVRALGASAMYGYQFYNMQLAAKEHGWAQFQAMENHYNLLYREDERELIPIVNRWAYHLCRIVRLPQDIWHVPPGTGIPAAARPTELPWANMTAQKSRT